MMYVVTVLLLITAALFILSIFVPPLTHNGRCGPRRSGRWKDLTACLSSDGGVTFLQHDPWESSMLVSAPKMGGCESITYDCLSTDANALLKYYASYDEPHVDPPQGRRQFMKYTECCLRQQCRLEGAVDYCGPPPNINNDMPSGIRIVEPSDGSLRRPSSQHNDYSVSGTRIVRLADVSGSVPEVSGGQLGGSGGQPGGFPGTLPRPFATAVCGMAVAFMAWAAAWRRSRSFMPPGLSANEESFTREEMVSLYPELVE